jgi:predicted RNA binding protein YcfA (HicA-like mRNA interferase family)
LGKLEKLIEKAKSSPQNLSFEEFCWLCEYFGMAERRHAGSHRVYKRTEEPRFALSIQSDKGRAKPYQVKQFLDLLDEHGLCGHGEEED